jgi:signal transduction histidine kinase
MSVPNPQLRAAESIENAIAELSNALMEIDRLADNGAAIGWVARAMNNYLSVTEATLDLIADVVRPDGHAEVLKWIESLNHLGDMMAHSLGRLFRTSTPAEFPLKLDYVDVPLLMKRACDYHQKSADPKDLEIVCRTIGEVPQAWADRVAVAVVADNLLSNAVKFSNPGGQIVVQIMSGPGGIVCSVLDNGPGLTPAEQVHLFERGARRRDGLSANPASAGYGLAIAKEFVDRMGGRLWSDSEPGRGACFSFRLPYHP